jgi:hypothetical protein
MDDEQLERQLYMRRVRERFEEREQRLDAEDVRRAAQAPLKDPLEQWKADADALESQRAAERAERERQWQRELEARNAPPVNAVDVPTVETMLRDALEVERHIMEEAVGGAMGESDLAIRAEMAELRKSVDALAKTMEARENDALRKELNSLWSMVKELAATMRTFERVAREDRERAAKSEPVPVVDKKSMN